jgi:hypothetical protein
MKKNILDIIIREMGVGGDFQDDAAISVSYIVRDSYSATDMN